MSGQRAAQWRPDPWAVNDEDRSLRWWDGEQWTDSVRTWNGTEWVDGVHAPPPAEDGPTKPEPPPSPAGNPQQSPLEESSRPTKCPTCDSPVQDEDWRVCPHCGEALARSRYQPGDIVNGHVLGSDHTWHLIDEATPAQGIEGPLAHRRTGEPLAKPMDGKGGNAPILWATGGLVALLLGLLVVVLVANTQSARRPSTETAPLPSESVQPSDMATPDEFDPDWVPGGDANGWPTWNEYTNIDPYEWCEITGTAWFSGANYGPYSTVALGSSEPNQLGGWCQGYVNITSGALVEARWGDLGGPTVVINEQTWSPPDYVNRLP